MCGIAGIFTREAREPDPIQLRAMIDSVAHRGPDAQAVRTEPHIGLAAARLAIVDISKEADQPLTDASGELTIVFNGEIYNFKEVRSDLEQRGHRFLTHSDTEVVLNAYREWGVDCHSRFNGMWAFALWDRRKKTLLLSRDRFSVKPLYVAEAGEELFFGSEIKSLLAAGIPADLAADAFHNFCGGESMFGQIRAVSPGTWIEYAVDARQPIQRTWWNTAETLLEVPRRRKDRVEAFRELLVDAVRVRLRVDVKPAFTLSGGLDSSSLYAAYRLLKADARVRSATDDRPLDAAAFVVHFPGAAVDEGSLASKVTERYGESPIKLDVNPDDFRDLVTKVMWHQEGLVWNASVIAYHELYRQIADRGYRVVLEGHGGDELLAGYFTFADDAVKQRVRSLRIASAWSAARAASRTRNPDLGHVTPSPLRAMAGAIARAILPRGRARASDLKPMFDSGVVSMPEDQVFAADVPGLSPLKRALYGAFHTRVLPTILRVNDRATMAASVESRSPFLDHRLVSFAFSLPDEDLLGRGWTKRILREAVEPLLPPEIVWREKKLPFIVPQPEWFRRPPVMAALREAISDGTISRAPGLNRETFAQMLMRGARNGFTWRESTLLWIAYTYAIWCELFRVTDVRYAGLSRSTNPSGQKTRIPSIVPGARS
jgi:asparagine synthase (glutamine-hydrolysing)